MFVEQVHHRPHNIQLYDSLLTVPGATIKEQACTILNCQEPSFKIEVMNVQLKKSPHSCGLFAIAMAFDLKVVTESVVVCVDTLMWR